MNYHHRRALYLTTFLVAAATLAPAGARAAGASAVPVNPSGIGGVVTSSKGPEAGVWVIAETNELPTRLIKIVVTDDQGRFMLPELPNGNYNVWARGYGLLDSPRVKGAPGKNIDLKSQIAPTEKAAAEIYPANYWYAMLSVPAESEFPGTGPKGNGIAPSMKSQTDWMVQMKDGCLMCHQVGNKFTRDAPDHTSEGWAERISKERPDGDQALGDNGKSYTQRMGNAMTVFGRTRSLNMFADWSKRIAAGESPREKPPRPAGLERNIVLTSWDWGFGRFLHDLTVTDRHDPTVNANGMIYGISSDWGHVTTLNPKTSEVQEFGYKVMKGTTEVKILPPGQAPSQFPHNPMVDSKGRLWITDLDHRPKPNLPILDKPAYCSDGTISKYAKYYPQPDGTLTFTAVQLDLEKKQASGVPMCNSLHHLMFDRDRTTLFFSGGGSRVVSWVDTKVWDETHDPVKSMGWCPMVLDTNSKSPARAAADDQVAITPDRSKWNASVEAMGVSREAGGGEDGAKGAEKVFDPSQDTAILGFLYGMDPNAADGSMWYAKSSPDVPTGAIRFVRGTNPPETCRTEYFATPKTAGGGYAAFGGRGVALDSKGVAWLGYTSGQLGKFDRSKCKVLSGPTVADGQHCPEGWTHYDAPGPKLPGVKVGTSDYHYLIWTDTHDTFGLGKDVPILAGSNSDSLLAFDQKTEKFNVLRVPYPLGFHTRGMDGRIDDPKAGWKGKGIYATYSSQPTWHQEGGDDGTSGPQIVKFQMRPDPLAF